MTVKRPLLDDEARGASQTEAILGGIPSDPPCDVLVVGSGLAGLAAAIRAAETGATVLVLEKYESLERLTRSMRPTLRGTAWDQRPTGCNTELSQRGVSTLEILGGRVNPSLSVDEVVRRSEESGRGAINVDVVRVWAQRLNRDIEWLTNTVGLRRKERRPGVPDYRFGQIVAPMTEYLQTLGGRVVYGRAATDLLVSRKRRIIGVRALSEDGYEEYLSGATILAPGGFEGNIELCAAYVSPLVGNEVLLTGSPYNTGEWVHMAHTVGAKLINMNQIHVRTPDRRGGLGIKRLNNLAKFGIVVDGQGRRLFDESRLPEQTDLLAHVMLEGHGSAFLIFDEPLRQRFMDEYLGYRSTPEEFFFVSDSLEGLAKLEGIDGPGLAGGVLVFNAAVAADGTAARAVPPKSANEDYPKTAVRIETGPFYSFKLLVGLNQTMGGFKVDTRMQVVDLLERPIGGLFAAGEPVMGNIIYENYKVASDAATGLEMALSTGCIAGESAAAAAGQLASRPTCPATA
jgi:tricarballylate dehydrogenase